MQVQFNPEIDFYKEELDERIIEHLAKVRGMSLDRAMDVYYSSRLSEQIAKGMFGIENMDYKFLVEDLIEKEPEIFT